MEIFNHLNGPRALRDNRVSIYELLAKDTLESNLNTAFNHLINLSTQHTLVLYKAQNVIYLLLTLLLSKESISEQFYGLKRTKESSLNVLEWSIVPTIMQLLHQKPILREKLNRLKNISGLMFKVG
jgi:hypothetical protein